MYNIVGSSFLKMRSKDINIKLKFKEMRKKTNTYIELDSAKIKQIASIKNVSVRSVYSALRFQTNSSLAILIRAWALNNGGRLYKVKEV